VIEIFDREMSSEGFRELHQVKHLRTPAFTGARNRYQEQNQGSETRHRPRLIDILPPSVETLYLTRAEDCSELLFDDLKCLFDDQNKLRRLSDIILEYTSREMCHDPEILSCVVRQAEQFGINLTVVDRCKSPQVDEAEEGRWFTDGDSG
jgi:hypothetical protein